MRTVKVGDKFKFGHWVWKVDYVNECIFTAKIDDYKSPGAVLTWQIGQANALDWVKESATISKAARDEIVEFAKNSVTCDGPFFAVLQDKLNSMVRDKQIDP